MLLWLAACLAGVMEGASSPETDVSVAVGADVAVENLTFSELRKVFLGDRKFWTSNLRVTLLIRSPGSHEREVLLKRIYQMSEAQYSQYWIAKVFRHEAEGAPKVVYSAESAAGIAAEMKGAVVLVDASRIPKELKILRIDGRLPGAPGYPLR